MWLKDRTVHAGIRQTRRRPAKFQGYIEVKGAGGRCIIPVGPWRATKGQALSDAKTAERAHKEMQLTRPDSQAAP